MVELSNLPLTICSECIENVSISGAMKLKDNGTNDVNKSFINRYQNRPDFLEQLSLCEFFHFESRTKTTQIITIPHFVGMTSTPTYPPTASYAKATLIINIPWRKAKFHLLSDTECINIFETYIISNKFPKSVILAYNKLRTQYIEQRMHIEPIQKNEMHQEFDEGITPEEQQLLRVVSFLPSNIRNTVNVNGLEYNRGIKYDWSKRLNNVRSKKYKLYFYVLPLTQNKFLFTGTRCRIDWSSLVRKYCADIRKKTDYDYIIKQINTTYSTRWFSIQFK